jgi:uncharacterized glyoxalase superfamily protein PhnB
VIPLRYVQSVDAMRAFYIDRLGFQHMMGMVGADGLLDFGIVVRDGAMLMLSRPQDPGAVTNGAIEIYVEVSDVDGYHNELRGRGIPISRELTTQWWGDRNFGVVDPAGHLLWFYQTVGEMKPPQGMKLV